ncbi:hypothetical protein OK349_12055 [Sphingomonas sp. BT-65]|uniref:hypothetical protein n=1 Tax=Sphingomonas sp. BT-65 TaxID=2989821 RepID=UPI0022356FC4|nr:hypothetical protein [Sphingomonas sp. BT-65]MCW4462442.1 hypothetical protein [Sphingomonas sp. BT-65]
MRDHVGIAAEKALAGARTRSAPVNAAWLAGPLQSIAARFTRDADATQVEAQALALLQDADWAEWLLAPLLDALRADPWFEPPFKTSRDALRTGIVLVDSPALTIAATITSADALGKLPAPATLVIPGRVTLTRYVRGGNARMRRWRAGAAGPDLSALTEPSAAEIETLILDDGDVVRQDGRRCGHLIVDADSDVVALTATIKPGASPLMREYAVADGRFVRAASADDAASRIEMLLAFLRASGRADAAEAFESASRHPAFHLRWAAMREWLMLDASAARSRLVEMGAGDPNAEIRAVARATLPALDRRLAKSCHA